MRNGRRKLALDPAVQNESGAHPDPECAPEVVKNLSGLDQAMSKRSRFITLVHAATKSFTNFSFESAQA